MSSLYVRYPSAGGTTLPPQAGHAGQFLTTDGSALSWVAVSGGGGASVALDNLSGVAINASLVFDSLNPYSIAQADDTAADNTPAATLTIKGQTKTNSTGAAGHGGDVVIQGGAEPQGSSTQLGGNVILRWNGGYGGGGPFDVVVSEGGKVTMPSNLVMANGRGIVYTGTEPVMQLFTASQGGLVLYQNISDGSNGYAGNTLLLGAETTSGLGPFKAGYFGSTGVFSGIASGNLNQYPASAIMGSVSTTKGFLPPVMTTTQKNAISSPALGLMVFDSTLAKLCVYTGSAWETITSI
jgi:hypothetical protein